MINYFYRIAAFIERIAALFQGKGYGSATIKLENSLVHKFFNSTPSLAIDVGGNIGEYSAELRKRNKNLEIHIFEPSNYNIKKLKRRFIRDEQIKIVPFALDEKNGSTRLFSDKIGSGLGSLNKRRLDHFKIPFKISEKIKTIRFENYWKIQLNKRRINLMKIDVEGYELKVLKGLGKSIAFIDVIQFEFGGSNIDSKTFFQDFWYFFKEHDFNLYRIAPFGAQKIKKYQESDEFFSATNYIAVNKK